MIFTSDTQYPRVEDPAPPVGVDDWVQSRLNNFNQYYSILGEMAFESGH
jgi:hypothetical protein